MTSRTEAEDLISMARIFLPRAGSKDWSLYILWDQGFCQHSWCVWWAGAKGSTYITSIFGMTKLIANMVGKLVIYKEVEQMSKYVEDNGSQVCHYSGRE